MVFKVGGIDKGGLQRERERQRRRREEKEGRVGTSKNSDQVLICR